MNIKFPKYRFVVMAVLMLVVVGLGCGQVRLPAAVIDRAPQPAASPTLPPPVRPLANETEAAYALEAQVVAVYETVSSAVVNITSRGYSMDMFMQPMPQQGSGSGFVYDDTGNIVTNFHVIEGAEELLVMLVDGQVFEAQLVGTDPTNDLAVIKIDAGVDLPEPMPLADSDQLVVGQFVLAIGNPFGLDQTLTTGVISALGRIIESPQDNRFIGEAIQTDAAINPGNSGGPLLDLQGRVIGVNSQIISPSRASAGIGFAVPSNTVRRVVPELISRGFYPHVWIGTQMFPLTPAVTRILREADMDIPVNSGLLVVETVPGAPADRAGLRGASQVVRIGGVQVPVGGDIIIAIDGQPIANFEEFTVYLETQKLVGETIEVTIIRDGAEQIITLTLEARPEQR